MLAKDAKQLETKRKTYAYTQFLTKESIMSEKVRNVRGFVRAYLASATGKTILSKTATRQSLNNNMSHAFERALSA